MQHVLTWCWGPPVPNTERGSASPTLARRCNPSWMPGLLVPLRRGWHTSRPLLKRSQERRDMGSSSCLNLFAISCHVLAETHLSDLNKTPSSCNINDQSHPATWVLATLIGILLGIGWLPGISKYTTETPSCCLTGQSKGIGEAVSGSQADLPSSSRLLLVAAGFLARGSSSSSMRDSLHPPPSLLLWKLVQYWTFTRPGLAAERRSSSFLRERRDQAIWAMLPSFLPSPSHNDSSSPRFPHKSHLPNTHIYAHTNTGSAGYPSSVCAQAETLRAAAHCIALPPPHPGVFPFILLPMQGGCSSQPVCKVCLLLYSSLPSSTMQRQLSLPLHALPLPGHLHTDSSSAHTPSPA